MKKEKKRKEKPEDQFFNSEFSQGYVQGKGFPGFLHNLSLDIRRNKMLYVFLAIIVTYFIIFNYLPMFGLLMAFEKFNIVKGVFGSKWVGLQHFKTFFSGPFVGRLMRNTVLIGVLDLLVNFPAPIIFALLLNEIKWNPFKKTVQTISYLPYFISSVVAMGLVINFTKAGGVISSLFSFMTGGQSENLLNIPGWFRPIYILSGTWQGLGYGSIIYLAALSGIDQELYDAAKVDGAGRLRQCWHITLPGISSMIIIMFIMRMGSVFSVGADKILLLYNSANYEVSDVINTYVYRLGMQEANYGMSTAVGLFNSLIGTALLLTSNAILRKLTDTSMF